jgi:hypothetical protein
MLAEFAKEHLDNHIKLPKMAAFFPFIQKMMDNQRHHENLNKYKGNVSDEIEEYMVRIVEYKKMNNIKNKRQKHHYNSSDDFPVDLVIHVNAFHKSVLIYVCFISIFRFRRTSLPPHQSEN